MTNTSRPAPTTNSDVQMGDTVVMRGVEYVVSDEPRYVRERGHQMIEWNLTPVPAGLKTGLISGAFRVWPTETTNVVH